MTMIHHVSDKIRNLFLSTQGLWEGDLLSWNLWAITSSEWIGVNTNTWSIPEDAIYSVVPTDTSRPQGEMGPKGKFPEDAITQGKKIDTSHLKLLPWYKNQCYFDFCKVYNI